MTRRHAPLATALAPALATALRRALPAGARVLELGSGTGELAVALAAALPGVTWQPSDPDPESRASVAAWTAREGRAGVLPPLALDLLAPAWRLQACDAVVAVNVLHAAGPGAPEALLAGAAAALPRGGALCAAGLARPPAGAALEAVRAGAARHGFAVAEDGPLPRGCRLVLLVRT